MISESVNGRRDDWTPEALAASGFVGWIRWSDCPSGFDAIDKSAGGVYVVFRDGPIELAYLDRSPAGTFRGDPTVGRAAFDANWVQSARVVYIGKRITVGSGRDSGSSSTSVAPGSGATGAVDSSGNSTGQRICSSRGGCSRERLSPRKKRTA